MCGVFGGIFTNVAGIGWAKIAQQLATQSYLDGVGWESADENEGRNSVA